MGREFKSPETVGELLESEQSQYLGPALRFDAPMREACGATKRNQAIVLLDDEDRVVGFLPRASLGPRFEASDGESLEDYRQHWTLPVVVPSMLPVSDLIEASRYFDSEKCWFLVVGEARTESSVQLELITVPMIGEKEWPWPTIKWDESVVQGIVGPDIWQPIRAAQSGAETLETPVEPSPDSESLAYAHFLFALLALAFVAPPFSQSLVGDVGVPRGDDEDASVQYKCNRCKKSYSSSECADLLDDDDGNRLCSRGTCQGIVTAE
jgi:hypothetical protein